uniref:Uncharacterized protein n=1 Tax=Arundo donax TaxID=35708 RepID=A0A0A9BEI3_ARUDO
MSRSNKGKGTEEYRAWEALWRRRISSRARVEAFAKEVAVVSVP